MKNIVIVSSNSPHLAAVSQLLKATSIVVHQTGDMSGGYSEYDAVLLLDPYMINREYFSAWRIWKNYLSYKAPNTCLLIAGFKEVKHPNYINLLDVNKDFDWQERYREAFAVKDIWVETEDLTNGRDIVEKIEVFFKGHSRQGIIDSLTNVRANLDSASLSYHGSDALNKCSQPFSEVWFNILKPGLNSVTELYGRWHYYYPYLQEMPFHTELQAIEANKFVGDLNKLYSGLNGYSISEIQESPNRSKELEEKEKLFESLNAFRRIGDLSRVLRKINSLYVNPEERDRVLLIDDDKTFHEQIKRNFPMLRVDSLLGAENVQQYILDGDYQLILLDLQLEGGDANNLEGVDLIPKIKEWSPEVPLCVVSTHFRETIVKKTLSLGADYFLNKGTFDTEEWNRIFTDLKAKGKIDAEKVINENLQLLSGTKPNILLIEDEKIWQRRISELSNKYEYTIANTVQQAKDRLNTPSNSFDLIILDLYFAISPEIEENKGKRFIKEIKADKKNIPVIVITNSPEERDESEAWKLGADFYLLKSHFNTNLWLRSIGHLIEKKKLQDQLNSVTA